MNITTVYREYCADSRDDIVSEISLTSREPGTWTVTEKSWMADVHADPANAMPCDCCSPKGAFKTEADTFTDPREAMAMYLRWDKIRTELGYVKI